MAFVWIIGNNGLLGSAIQRVLQNDKNDVFLPAERFHWGNEVELAAQFASAVKSFANFVGAGNSWQIYWAAGIGTMSSAEAELEVETQTLSMVLKLIGSETGLATDMGYLAFASSAGAIYAGAREDIITENTPVAPTTAYAHEKLMQEQMIKSFANDYGVTVLIARISTLYGAGQSIGKQQGLLTHIARSILRNKPVHIYVPFDTIRDYIDADDAAFAIVESIVVLGSNPGAHIKIIASEKPVTIAEIISIFKRIVRRSPRIVASASKLTDIYARRIQFRSVAVPINKSIPKKDMLVGIAQVMAAERLEFMRASR